jgi:hypothetical protein
MDGDQFADTLAKINNFSTAASILCVLPTYFLGLQPATYRLVLSFGIVFGLSTFAFLVTIVPWVAIVPIVGFSPLVVVLIAILAGIKRVTRVGLYSTVVLACVIVDWVGISWLMLALS